MGCSASQPTKDGQRPANNVVPATPVKNEPSRETSQEEQSAPQPIHEEKEATPQITSDPPEPQEAAESTTAAMKVDAAADGALPEGAAEKEIANGDAVVPAVGKGGETATEEVEVALPLPNANEEVAEAKSQECGAPEAVAVVEETAPSMAGEDEATGTKDAPNPSYTTDIPALLDVDVSCGATDYLGDSDSNWMDCSSRDGSVLVDSRAGSPAATAPHQQQEGATNGTTSKIGASLNRLDLSLSTLRRGDGSPDAHYDDGVSYGSGERLVIKAIRRPNTARTWGADSGKTPRGAYIGSGKTPRGAYGGRASPRNRGGALVPIGKAEGATGAEVLPNAGGNDTDAKGAYEAGREGGVSRTSNYYVNLRGGAPLKFKHSIQRPVTGFGWTCMPSSGSASVAGLQTLMNSTRSKLFAPQKPVCFEVKRMAPDGSLLSSTIVSGMAARLVRGATSCGTAGTEVAIMQASNGNFTLSRSGAMLGGVSAGRQQGGAKKRISMLR